MVDTRSEAQRSRIMAAVHSKNTKPELFVRRFLWSRGIRYRIHYKNLPGSPDIVIPRCKIVIFIHGCFWHGHKNCKRGRLPKSKIDYWKNKIEANMSRDLKIQDNLETMGWKYLIIWDCQITTKKSANIALLNLLKNIENLCPELRIKQTELGNSS